MAFLLERFLDENIEKSPAFRALAKRLAEMTLERISSIEAARSPAEQASSQHPSRTQARATASNGRTTGATPTLDRARSAEVVPLRIGDAELELSVTGETQDVAAARKAAHDTVLRHEDTNDYLQQTAASRSIDLERIALRCRLKADSCLHQVVRQNQQRDSEEELASRQRMNELIATARSIPDCFLWMFFRKGVPTSDSQLRLIAGCYEAMADAAELCQEIEPIGEWPDDEQVYEALQVLATTSSGLRVALAETWLTQADIDQDEVHRWLKLVTAEHRFLVKNHMQLSDPADPVTDVAEAHDRAREMLRLIETDRSRTEAAERLMKRALYHAQRVREASSSPYDEEPPAHDCKKINGVIDELVETAPGNLDALLQQIATVVQPMMFADCVTPHARLRSAAERLERSRSSGESEQASNGDSRERAWSQRVLEVRELLKGHQLVVIGGEPRRDAIERMTDAFGLEAVVWPELSQHGSAEPMRAPISSPRTRLVVVLIKLTGHEHAERARELARQASVPFVLMPAGYNPEMIAAEVLAQASAQLASA